MDSDEPTKEELQAAKESGLESRVVFNIPGAGLAVFDYCRFIDQVVLRQWLLPENKQAYHNVVRNGAWNCEGGLSCITINSRYFGHCKFYKIDGERSTYDWLGRGIMIRDHCDSSYDIFKVLAIADDFERSLNEQRIPYERKNYKRTHDLRW